MIRLSLRCACAFAALSAPIFAQSTIRLTAGIGGAEPNGASAEPYVSGDGRFVVFSSLANNLTPNDTSAFRDVFLYDVAQGSLELITVRIPGTTTASTCAAPVVSDDGNVVAFWSDALDLVVGDTSIPDVYVRDRSAGTTTRITTGWAGASTAPSITPDGRYVAFQSLAENVVASGPAADVFRYDRQTNAFVLISQSTAGLGGDAESIAPRISADGNLVTFVTAATNLLFLDTNMVVDAYIRDVAAARTRRTSVSWIGAQLASGTGLASMTRDGRKVCFVNAGADVSAGDPDGADDVFVRILQNGYLSRASTPASRKGGNGTSNDAEIAGDGRYVAFRSDATDLIVPDPTPGAADIYLKDLETGAVEIVSLSSTGSAAGDSFSASPSADGRFVAFATGTGLVPGDGTGALEIYLRDRGVVIYTTPCAGDGNSAPCPCGTPGSTGNGCENYGLTGGVRLSATGNPSVTSDTVHLALTGFPTPNTALGFVQGDALLAGGFGVPFGDGVQCVGGNTRRFGRRNAIGGASEFGAGVAGDPPLSVAGLVGAPGGTRYYQVVYLTAGSFCGQARRNWSNSIAIVWVP